MKKILKTAVVAGFAAALLIPATPASAAPANVGAITGKLNVSQAAKTTYKYTSTVLNLRTGASTKYKVLLSIPKSKKLTVKKTKTGWSQVVYGKKAGWVSSKYLQNSLPKSTAKNSKVKTTSLSSKARSYANKYGCKNAGIVWNSKKLGKGANGTADWYNNDILLRSSMPSYRLEYVTAHECFHLKQYAIYKGDVRGMAKAFNKVYGRNSTDYYGLERLADCMTRAKGIKVYNYTNKCSGKPGQAAKKLLTGKKV